MTLSVRSSEYSELVQKLESSLTRINQRHTITAFQVRFSIDTDFESLTFFDTVNHVSLTIDQLKERVTAFANDDRIAGSIEQRQASEKITAAITVWMRSEDQRYKYEQASITKEPDFELDSQDKCGFLPRSFLCRHDSTHLKFSLTDEGDFIVMPPQILDRGMTGLTECSVQ